MAGESKLNRNISISGGGVTVGGVTEQIEVDNIQTFSKTIPKNLTDAVVQKPEVDFSECKLMAIVASKDCTVKTNSTISPAETLELKANRPLHWIEGDPTANKFLSVDVTVWYVTTGGEDTLLKIIIGEDGTPGISG